MTVERSRLEIELDACAGLALRGLLTEPSVTVIKALIASSETFREAAQRHRAGLEAMDAACGGKLERRHAIGAHQLAALRAAMDGVT